MTDPDHVSDPDAELAMALAAQLPARLAPTGSDFAISALHAPSAGYSGRTAFFTASWRQDGQVVRRDLVLRMQSPDHQLFVQPDALRQAEVMRRLGAHPGVRTPEIVLTEADPEVLGTPFYLMARTEGRVPSDVPSWHKAGWTMDLTAAERARLHDNALRSLVAVHAIDDPDDLAFLAPATGEETDGSVTALRRHVDQLVAWHGWCGDELRIGAETIARGLEVLVDSLPATTAAGVVWGDARVGNICFADDLSVAALFDWETATVGPPDIDVGWWLMFERYLCEALGFTRPPGMPDDEQIVQRYEDLGGRLSEGSTGISYFTLLAAVTLSLITNRLAILLERDGLAAEIAHRYPATAVSLVERYLHDHTNRRSSLS